jgi:tRNA pseudouridine38-40 synthase
MRPTPRPPTTSQPRSSDYPPGDEPAACRLRLDFGYDGGEFSGWARQPGRRTVQQVAEEALGHLLRLAPVSLTVAGRTDAGVHAHGQVAHVDVPAPAWAAVAPVALRRLRGLLPPDIRVSGIAIAPPGFDARFSALCRRYSYRVCDDPSGPDPLRRHDTLAYRRPLDVAAMNEAAALLLGEHDFAAFCRRREGASTIRELLDLRWDRAEPGVLAGRVVADAFCHSMVRALTGALLKVGDGRPRCSGPGCATRPCRSCRRTGCAWKRCVTQRPISWPGGLRRPAGYGLRATPLPAGHTGTRTGWASRGQHPECVLKLLCQRRFRHTFAWLDRASERPARASRVCPAAPGWSG